MQTVTGNWLLNAKAQLSCGGLNEVELRSLEVAYQYEYFLEVDPELIPQNTEGAVIGSSVTLVGLYNKIVCGTLLSELEYAWAQAEVARLSILYIP